MNLFEQERLWVMGDYIVPGDNEYGDLSLNDDAAPLSKGGTKNDIAGNALGNDLKPARETTYVYLNFDGEDTVYDNPALNLSFSVSVQNSWFSDEQKQTILTALTEKYEADGVVFTLERPPDEPGSDGYSTLYFGKSDSFKAYGEFFGVAETHD